MYAELLQQLYYQERKKLEAMWVYKQESKLRLLQLRKSIAERIVERLTVQEMLGRADIADEVKDNLLREPKNEDKINQRIEKNLDLEFSSIEQEQKEELKNANYSPEEYADYLIQLEKVFALEDALSEQRLFPDAVYEEQKSINDRKEDLPSDKI